MKISRTISFALCFAAAFCAPAAAQPLDGPITFTTVAGQPGTRGFTSGTGSNALFSDPIAVAIDSAGNAYVADGGGQTIRRVTPAGAVSILAGSGGAIGTADGTGTAARFNGPTGVAVDSEGTLFVTDALNHTIRKITPVGVVTTFAGLAGVTGSADGTGSAARFNFPVGIAVDSTGTLFVVDRTNQTIRKITPEGVVSTFAGLAGAIGSTNGVGSAARFGNPTAIAIDSAGNAYVADTGVQTIRKITPAGVVTTLAGLTSNLGSTDGIGSAARFNLPSGIAVDGGGNVYVVENGNSTIRKITPTGVVTTVGGVAGTTGSADGIGSAARFNRPGGIALDSAGNLYIADELNATLRKGEIITTPTIATGPKSQSGLLSGIITLTVDATGGDLRYQWRFNGIDLPGATGKSLTLNNAQPAQAGSYSVVVSNTFGSATSAAATLALTAPPPGQTEAYAWTTLAGASGQRGSIDAVGSEARFDSPYAVTTDATGNVYMSEYFGHVIRRITPSGVVSTVVGSPGVLGSTDGAANAALLNRPSQIAFDRTGNLFVADYGNSVIRRITPDGSVTTVAGVVGSRTTANGTGSAVRFNGPTGVAVDAAGNLYVAEWDGCVIRKITPAGVGTTLAGVPSVQGRTDGTGPAALFNHPENICVDGSGNVYVADFSNAAVRKISPEGVVTTIAGLAGSSGAVDGPGSAARFNTVFGLSLDRFGNLFVADTNNNAIRKITPAGVVTTVGGTFGVSGITDGIGSVARFAAPRGVTVDANGTLYVAELGLTIRKGTPIFPLLAPTIIVQPSGPHIAAGASATFTVATSGAGFTYQWKKDGVALAGGTGATYQIANAAAGDMGFYSVVISDNTGSVESAVAILTVATSGSGRLANLSTRALVQAGGDLTVGFVLRGSGAKSVLVRAVGPTLGSFGVDGALGDPRLEVIPAGATVASNSNDDWAGGATLASAFASVGAFALPAASKDAAVLATLPVAGYTARVTSTVAGGSGIAIAEVYDRDPAGATSRLANVSTLGFVGTGPLALVPGFVIDGTAPKLLLIRAVGPGIAVAPFNVSGALADPQLAIIPLGKTFTVASNDNWNNDATLAAAFGSAGAFALPPSSKDAAVVVRLPPGGYTVTVSGVADTTGRALVEIYDLDP